MAPFSKRTSFADLETNPLSTALDQLRRQGRDILDLTETNPTRCSFASLNDRLLEALSHPSNLAYTPEARGLLEAREAVAAYYGAQGVRLDADAIFLTAGTSEAYSHLFHLLADPGDTVLLPRPGYPLFDSLAALAGLVVDHFDPKSGPSGAMSRDARAMVFVNPANPTGEYLSPGRLRQAVDFGAAHKIPLISDEVFYDFVWDDAPRASMASMDIGLTFTLGGISKMLGLPQMKLSWIVVQGPPDQRRQACARLEHILDTYLSVSAPPQQALRTWFMNREAFVNELLARVRHNRDSMARALVGSSVTASQPQGGWMGVLKLPRSCDEEKTAIDLLEKRRVLVHPGYYFDIEEPSWVVSYLLPEPAFREAARLVAEHWLKS